MASSNQWDFKVDVHDAVRKASVLPAEQQDPGSIVFQTQAPQTSRLEDTTWDRFIYPLILALCNRSVGVPMTFQGWKKKHWHGWLYKCFIYLSKISKPLCLTQFCYHPHSAATQRCKGPPANNSLLGKSTINMLSFQILLHSNFNLVKSYINRTAECSSCSALASRLVQKSNGYI